VSTKALRLYEQRGMMVPYRTAAGWRVYGPDQMTQAAEIIALRTLGLSLVQIERLLKGESKGLAPFLAAHQATLEGRIGELVRMVGKLRDLQADLVQGQPPTAGDMARLLKPATELNVTLELPWPWGGEQVALEYRSLNYITGPLGSGKTRLALRLAEALPDAAFLGLERSADQAGAARAQLDADPGLKSRVDQIMAWLSDDGAVVSNALIALIVGLECAGPAIVVVDLVEQGLGEATQEALSCYLRNLRGAGRRPLFLLTRSSAILDLSAVGADETIILCPANHSPPFRVAPYPGAPGYEAVATCLASPEVRARTEGVIAWRPHFA
jgi:DNA-binding transcriptional MerR regulator